MLLLDHVGAKSAQKRTTPLVYGVLGCNPWPFRGGESMSGEKRWTRRD